MNRSQRAWHVRTWMLLAAAMFAVIGAALIVKTDVAQEAASVSEGG